MPSPTVFCAHCQQQTEHRFSVDHDHQEIVFTCSQCERALKLPVGMGPDAIRAYFDEHNRVNAGQVKAADHEAEVAAALASAEDAVRQAFGL